MHLILGPSYQEVVAGEPFTFLMGERVLITQVVAHMKNGDNKNFQVLIAENVSTTSTFVGNLFGKIAAEATLPQHIPKKVVNRRPRTVLQPKNVPTKTPQIVTPVIHLATPDIHLATHENQLATPGIQLATPALSDNLQIIVIENVVTSLKSGFLFKLRNLHNDFVSKNPDEKLFMQQCSTDIEKYINGANVAIDLPKDFLQIISSNADIKIKGSALCYCKLFVNQAKKKSASISGYFRPNAKVRKAFLENKLSDEEIGICWTIANFNRHLKLHESKTCFYF